MTKRQKQIPSLPPPTRPVELGSAKLSSVHGGYLLIDGIPGKFAGDRDRSDRG